MAAQVVQINVQKQFPYAIENFKYDVSFCYFLLQPFIKLNDIMNK